jgi:cell division protein FtsQ
MPVAAPADRRFRRAHVPPARRRRWRPSWRTAVRVAIVAAVVGYGGYRGVTFALASDALTVARITVTGTERMSRGEVLALLDDARGSSMLTTGLDAWRQKLLDAPWVADATIRRVLPSTLAVVISERQPMGIGRLGDGLYLIDRRGAIIDEFGPKYAEFDLPIVDGLHAPRAGGDLLIDEGRAALVARLLAELQARPDLAARVSQIDVSDVRDAAVVLKGDTALVRLGDGRFAERIQSYLELAPRLRERVPDIDYVDLRFDERVYVRPHGSGRKAQGD